MLKAIGLPMPKTIFAHGWWLTGSTKMSKSLGNVINPMDMIDRCGVDAFRYFLLAEMSPGNDASFTEEAFVGRYNSDLANDLGNLLSRVVKMVRRSAGGVIPTPGVRQEEDLALDAEIASARRAMEANLLAMKIDQGLAAVMNAVRAGNRYLEKTAPWTLAKQGNADRLNTVLYTAADALRQVAVLLAPVMPEKMAELRTVLGYDEAAAGTVRIADLQDAGDDPAGRRVLDSAGLFPRIVTEEKAVPAAAKPEAAPKPVNVVETIDIAEFGKVSLRTAEVLAAERVEGADKLLKLRISLGKETRQIVSGIASWYAPEELVGKTIVVVANLKPATIRGVESDGMLLAAKTGKELRLVTVDGVIAPGSQVG